MRIRATYDVEAEAMYVYFPVQDTDVVKTVQIDSYVEADVNAAGEVIGLEFSDVELETAP